MSIRRISISAVILAVLIISMKVFSLTDKDYKTLYTIGCPNNIGGMVMDYAIRTYCHDDIEVQEDLPMSAFLLADCCSPKTGISLTSGELQGAVMCPDSAKELVDKDERFIIVDDFTFNTEVMMLASNISDAAEIRKIGYMNGQERQKINLEEKYGGIADFIAVAATSLPYALELGEVDAAVLDFGTAVHMENEFVVLTSDKPTSVLVLNKDFYHSEHYETLKKALELAFEDMNNFDDFALAMSFISSEPVDRKGFDKWLSLDRKFQKR